MSNFVTKEVNFNGTVLTAVQNKENGKIYAGVSWLCKGIGLSDDRTKYERQKIQTDLVLSKGGQNFTLPTKGGKQEILCLELNFVPLWLAKVTITPTMQEEQPELTEKLVKYQLEAKDVLTDAFLSKSLRKKPKDLSVKQHLNIANSLVQITGVKKEIAYAVAIDEAEKETGEDLSAYKRLLPSAEHNTGFLKATMIGERVGKKATDINILLRDLGQQYKDENKKWRLTDQGKSFGEEFPYKRNNHSDYQIRWNETVMTVILDAQQSA